MPWSLSGRSLRFGPDTMGRQAETAEGRRPGTTSDECEHEDRRAGENRELRRANEILKAAAAFFGEELGRK